jgi:hypothetical protein
MVWQSFEHFFYFFSVCFWEEESYRDRIGLVSSLVNDSHVV